MKVFISSDLEGTAGIVDWDQCRPDGARYEHAIELLTGEINAAIEGAMAAGADEFLVNDSHGRMANLRPERLAGSARTCSGRFKPLYMMQGLDASFDACFFLSYHGSMASAGSILSHTYFPGAFSEVTINGTVTGEAGLNALVAQAHGVPVVLVTGDETTAEETERFCPGVRRAVVKSSLTRFAAESLHPDAACALIRAEAEAAIAGTAAASPVAIALPARIEITFRTSDYAELASRIAGVVRDGAIHATLDGDDPLELFHAFITVVLLCRGLE